MPRRTRSPAPTRRELLHALGTGLAVAPLASIACKSSPSGSPDARGTDDGRTVDTAPPIDAPGGDNCGPEPTAWAVGGTAAMTAKACYPDPFAGDVGACPLVVCPTTAGPCTATAPVRQDVSEGYPGLPVRLALKLVTAGSCAPLEGASVEIWHTQVSGVYSGVTPSPGFCSGGDPEAPTKSYFRGIQTSDANGRVDFDTCFPGWYPGRAVHIHFRVVVGGTSYLVSQLFFPQPIVDDIFASHPTYTPEGAPDRTNDNDGVTAPIDDLAPYVVDVRRMSDGAMLASKVIAIRAANQANCTP